MLRSVVLNHMYAFVEIRISLIFQIKRRISDTSDLCDVTVANVWKNERIWMKERMNEINVKLKDKKWYNKIILKYNE